MSKQQASLEDLEREVWLRARNEGNIVWTTKNGDQIPIKDMSIQHLLNTINMLYRNVERKDMYYEALGSIGDMDF